MAGKRRSPLVQSKTVRWPMYVRAVIPDYAGEDWRHGQCSAWYLGSEDETLLDDETLVRVYEDWWKKSVELGRDLTGNLVEDFFDYLESTGQYTLFHSTVEGFTVLPADECLNKK